MELKSAIQFYQVCSVEPLSHQAFTAALDYPQPPENREFRLIMWILWYLYQSSFGLQATVTLVHLNAPGMIKWYWVAHKIPSGPKKYAWETLKPGKMPQITIQCRNHTDTISVIYPWVLDTLCTTDCWIPPWRPPPSLEKWLIQAWGREGIRWIWSTLECKKQGSTQGRIGMRQKNTSWLERTPTGWFWDNLISQWVVMVMVYYKRISVSP